MGMLARVLLSALAALSAASCSDEDKTATPKRVGAGGGGIGGGQGGVAADCSALCDAVIEFGCDDSGCAQRCLDSYAAATTCKEVLGAYIGCLGDHADGIPSCFEYPMECQGPHDDYYAC